MTLLPTVFADAPRIGEHTACGKTADGIVPLRHANAFGILSVLYHAVINDRKFFYIENCAFFLNSVEK